MGLETLLEKYQNQTVTIAVCSSFDGYGNPVYSTSPSTYAALIVQKMKAIRDKGGVEKVSSCQVYLRGDTVVAIEDQITLPDNSQPQIIAVQRYPDFTGAMILTEVYT
jgi:hypothetical protein